MDEAVQGILVNLIPVLLIWLMILVFGVLHHYRNVKYATFQGLYSRILLLFPTVSTLAFVSYALPSTGYYIEVLIGLVEGYVFLMFFGLLVGWAWQFGDVDQAILNCDATNVLCYTKCRSCGPRFDDGDKALRRLYIQIAQIIVVKPFLLLCEAIAITIRGTPPNQSALLVIGGLNAISIIVALRGMLNLYRALRSQRLLKGLKPVIKFTIVKWLVLFIVINSLLFLNLIEDGKIKIPTIFTADLDPSSIHFEEYGAHRLLSFIFQIEALFLTVLSLFAFRATDMDVFLTASKDVPDYEKDVDHMRRCIFHFNDFIKLSKRPVSIQPVRTDILTLDQV